MLFSLLASLLMWLSFLVLQGTGKWYELQDLQVTDILPQMITLSEAYIQVSTGFWWWWWRGFEGSCSFARS